MTVAEEVLEMVGSFVFAVALLAVLVPLFETRGGHGKTVDDSRGASA